jgi:hypothetical protein
LGGRPWRRGGCAGIGALIRKIVSGRAEDDFGGVAVNSEDADGNNGRLGSPRISPFLTTRPALFPLRPCGRVVGIGRQAYASEDLFVFVMVLLLCM